MVKSLSVQLDVARASVMRASDNVIKIGFILFFGFELESYLYVLIVFAQESKCLECVVVADSTDESHDGE